MERGRGTAAGVEAFVEQARTLRDEDRLALAEARAAIDETFHAGAWRAANEVVAQRGQEYLEAWVRVGAAFVPERLEGLVQKASGAADAAEVARWQEVARLARVAMEDALMAFVGADLLRPPDLRALCGPWKAMLESAHERARGRQPPSL